MQGGIDAYKNRYWNAGSIVLPSDFEGWGSSEGVEGRNEELLLFTTLQLFIYGGRGNRLGLLSVSIIWFW